MEQGPVSMDEAVVDPARLLTKVGLLTVENEILREQIQVRDADNERLKAMLRNVESRPNYEPVAETA